MELPFDKRSLGLWDKKTAKEQMCGEVLHYVFTELLDSYDNNEIELFVLIVRCIWLRRNAVIHREIFMDPNQLLQEAREALEDFHKANMRGEEATPVVTRNKDTQNMGKWTPPPVNYIKMN